MFLSAPSRAAIGHHQPRCDPRVIRDPIADGFTGPFVVDPVDDDQFEVTQPAVRERFERRGEPLAVSPDRGYGGHAGRTARCPGGALLRNLDPRGLRREGPAAGARSPCPRGREHPRPRPQARPGSYIGRQRLTHQLHNGRSQNRDRQCVGDPGAESLVCLRAQSSQPLLVAQQVLDHVWK